LNTFLSCSFLLCPKLCDSPPCVITHVCVSCFTATMQPGKQLHHTRLLTLCASAAALGPPHRQSLRSGVLVAASPAAGLQPSPNLGAGEMVLLVSAALKADDSESLPTLFRFMTPAGRIAIAPPPPQAGLQGGVTEAWFEDNANHPLLCLLECEGFAIDEPTLIEPTMTRGGLGTVKLQVDMTEQPSRNFLVSLEQQRRPPLAGCWLIKEALALERTAFQMLNEGSTEQW